MDCALSLALPVALNRFSELATWVISAPYNGNPSLYGITVRNILTLVVSPIIHKNSTVLNKGVRYVQLLLPHVYTYVEFFTLIQ